MIAVFLTFLVALLLLLFFWLYNRICFFDRHKFPYRKPTFPCGNLSYGLHAADIIKEFYDEFKHQTVAFGLFFSLIPAIVITDLDVIEDILIKDFDKFMNRGIYVNKEGDPLSANIVSLENDEWRSLRQKLVASFSTQKMKLIFRTLMNVSYHTTSGINCSEMIEAKELLSKYATDVIGNVVYGIDMTALNNPNSKFREMGAMLYDYKTFSYWKMIFILYFEKLSLILSLKLYPSKISDFFLGIVETTVKYRKENNFQRNDVLDILLEIENESCQRLSMKEIAAHCFLFFIYGFETVASTGAFALYSLAVNSHVQEKLRDEITAKLARHDDKITFEAVEQMSYLQMVIDETLRLYPSLYHLFRKSSRDYKIAKSNLIIPKETIVFIPAYSIHRDAEYYPEPEKFDPERFSDDNRDGRHPMAFLPFGSGNRGCMGARFGLIQIKILIVQLLLRFRILPNEQTPKVIRIDPMKPSLSSISALWLKFEEL